MLNLPARACADAEIVMRALHLNTTILETWGREPARLRPLCAVSPAQCLQAPFVHLRVLAQCWSRPSSRTTIVSDIQLVFSSLQPVELYQCTGDRPRITLVTYQLYSNSPREQWSESSSDFIFSNMLRFTAVVASSMVRRYYGDTEWERRVKISKLLRANETTRRHPVTVAAPQQICKIFGEPRPVAFKSSQPSWSRITVTKQNKRDLKFAGIKYQSILLQILQLQQFSYILNGDFLNELIELSITK